MSKEESLPEIQNRNAAGKPPAPEKWKEEVSVSHFSSERTRRERKWRKKLVSGSSSVNEVK